MSEDRKEEWFAEWFDTPWYPILYGNRDEAEATAFIERLFGFLKDDLKASPEVLDLACGAGRHSRVFDALGCRVTGFDLSAQSIAKAKELGPDRIEYTEGDMRNLQLNKAFDLVVNLFTSFGYFEHFADNESVIASVRRHLREEGFFVLDFMNAPLVIDRLVEREKIERQGITFNIHRYVTDAHIVKEICFEAEGKTHVYQERVQAISPERLQELLLQQNFIIKNVFGDYNLTTFAPQRSPRVIVVAKPA